MSEVCVNTSSLIILVHTMQNQGLLSDLCGTCTSVYEMSRDSNSLQLVTEKPAGLLPCHRLRASPGLTEKQGGGVGTWAEHYKYVHFVKRKLLTVSFTGKWGKSHVRVLQREFSKHKGIAWLTSSSSLTGKQCSVTHCLDSIYIRCSLCLKVEEVLTDGRRIITFRNGTKKEISTDKRMTTISFFNGDVKKIMPDQRAVCTFCFFFKGNKTIKQFSNKVLPFILIYHFWEKLMRKGVGLTIRSGETAPSTRTKMERDEGNSQRRNRWVVGQAD